MSKDLTEALRAMMEKEDTSAPYEAKPRGSASPAKSSAALFTPPKSEGGGGIASPLTETAYVDRTYHPQTILTTPDGFLSVIIRPVNKTKFKDANGNTVEIIYKVPV